MAYQTSQGLASLGRNGDTMLMHVNPSEVAGLQSLAMSQGGSLTINPQTGLPEAFKLGGFFKSLLPMFAGMAVPASAGLWAGIAAGAATGALTNKDKLMGALTGGLGGYSGFGLGQGLRAAAAVPGAVSGSAAAPGIIGSTGEMGSSLLNASRGIAPGAVSATANAAGNIYNLADTAVNTSGLAAGNVNPALANLQNVANTSGFTASGASGASGVDKSFLGGMDRIGTGAKNIVTGQEGAFDAFKNSFVEPGGKPLSDLAGYSKIALPIGGAALGGIEPSDLYGEPINMDEAKKKQAYDPNASLNLSGDTGLRLYATGGTVQSGGIRDLYGTPDNQPTISPGLGGFGLGRLNNLAGEQAMTQAQTLGYADGGDVEGGNTGMNLDQLPSLNLNTGMQDGGMGGDALYSFNDKAAFSPVGRMLLSKMPQSDRAKFIGSGMGAFFGMQERPKQEYYTSSGELTSRYAMGGPVSFADGGDSNKEDALGLPSLSPDVAPETQVMNLGNIGLGQGLVRNLAENMQRMQGMQGSTTAQGQMPDQSNDSLIAKVTANLRTDPNYQPTNPIEASIVKQIKGTDSMQQGEPSLQGLGSLAPNQPMAPSYAPSVAMSPTYFAGMNAPQGYAEGGETSLNLDKLPSLNIETGKQTLAIDDDAYNPTPFDFSKYTGYMTPHTESSLRMAHMIREATKANPTPFDLSNYPSYMSTPSGPSEARRAHMFSNFKPGAQEAYKNFVARPRFAHGGYLDGQGDGMSDSIPATIEGKQPARLADGEFVIPADVVSHMGNGSSKAGSKRLYAMLDKVRKARTGHTKQGKQIKPEKYMPA